MIIKNWIAILRREEQEEETI